MCEFSRDDVVAMAKEIVEKYEVVSGFTDPWDECVFCKDRQRFGESHEPNCIVLVAKDVLTRIDAT